MAGELARVRGRVRGLTGTLFAAGPRGELMDAVAIDPHLRSRGVQALLDEAKRLDATELRKLSRRLLTLVDPDSEDRRAERELDRLERAATSAGS